MAGGGASTAAWTGANQAELIDNFLTFNLFVGVTSLSLGATSLAFVLLQQVETRIFTPETATQEKIKETKSRIKDLKRVVEYFLKSLYFAISGMASSIALDGVMEYSPPDRQEGKIVESVFGLKGPMVDLLEAGVSGGFLVGFLCFFALGVRMFTRIEFQNGNSKKPRLT